MTVDEKAEAVTRLYANKDFQNVILRVFIDEGIHSIVMNENVDSEPIRDLLKARRILHEFLYGIIQEAEIAKTDNKG